VLIVDEALAVGDARFQKKCFGRLEQLRASGTTVLFVTHDTGSVVQFCTRALIIDDGRIVGEGDPQRMAREYHRLMFDVPVAHDQTAPLSPPANGPQTSQDQKTLAPGSSSTPASAPSEQNASSPRVGNREVRYGSKDVEIDRIGLLDASGAETRVVDIHSEVVFHFQVKFQKDVANPVAYGFALANARGVEMYGTKSQLHGARIPPSRAGAGYQCRLQTRVPFVPGTYFLTVALAHDDDRASGEFLDYRFDALEFQVVGSPLCFTTCMVDLDAQLDHQSCGIS
jgi:lipopolysaccharide transport system ATP-binding protein